MRNRWWLVPVALLSVLLTVSSQALAPLVATAVGNGGTVSIASVRDGRTVECDHRSGRGVVVHQFLQQHHRANHHRRGGHQLHRHRHRRSGSRSPPGPTGRCGSPTSCNNSIGRITTAGVVTNYTGTGIDEPRSITAGPDGALWFTNYVNNSIGRITTAGVVTNYTGTGIDDPAVDHRRARRGAVVHQLGRTTRSDGSPPPGWSPTTPAPASTIRTTITTGPDGALWFTNTGNNSIGRITTAGVVTNYTGTGIDDPSAITAGPDGALWFTNEVRQLDRADHHRRGGDQLHRYRHRRTRGSITTGPDGALWFTNSRATRSDGSRPPGR